MLGGLGAYLVLVVLVVLSYYPIGPSSAYLVLSTLG